MNIVNLHHVNTQNVGDRNCSPALYFDLGSDRRDLWVTGGITGNTAIVGGGGLLHPYYRDRVRQVIEAARVGVLWGIGVNTHGASGPDYPEWMRSARLVGCRDDVGPYRWVPCASCMSPLFDGPDSPIHDVVVYAHATEPNNIPAVDGPRMTNFVQTMAEAVAFLASGRVVVTNTYHGAYWATMLGRTVVVYPFSNRHLFMRHRPVDGSKYRTVSDAVAAATSHPHALEECRAANRSFYAEVQHAVLAATSITSSRPYHSQCGEDRWLVENASLPTNGVFVDVGAGDGRYLSNTLHFEERGWTGLAFDPDPRNHAGLTRRSCVVDHRAISGLDGEAQFVQASNAYHSRLAGDGSLTVRTSTLAAAMAEHGVDRVDLLSIDTEGTEVEALRSIGAIRPKAIIVEHNTVGQPSTEDALRGLLAEMGYRVAHRTVANLIALLT